MAMSEENLATKIGSEATYDIEEFDRYGRRLFLTEEAANEYLNRPAEDEDETAGCFWDQ